MNVHFESIRLKRFRSYIEEATLNFDAAGVGLYFLKGKNNKELGSNGAGKSTIVDALMWCLYGKTVQGLKNPDVVPWTGKGATEVEVTLRIDDKKHVIKRTVGPNLLTIDGKEAAQPYVDTLIGLPADMIPYTIVMGQRQPLFFDLTPGEKLKIFSQTLDLERWEERSEHAAGLVKGYENEIAFKEREIASLERQLEGLERDIQTAKQSSDDWEAKRQSALENKESAKADLEAKLAQLNKSHDDADLKLERAETELAAINLEALIKEDRAQQARVDTQEREHIQAVRKESELKTLLDDMGDETCPTCQQPIKSKETLKKLTAEIKDKIKALRISDLAKAVNVAKQERDRVSEKLQIQEQAAKKFKNEASDARTAIDRLVKPIAETEAAIKAIDAMADEALNQTNPYTEHLRELKKRLRSTNDLIAQAKEGEAKKRESCERARYWIKGFKDIKLLIVEEILQELEIVTNGMCDEFGLVNWRVEYDIERETKSGTISRGLNVVILSPGNKSPVKWGAWSGGEGQRLKLIGSAALSSVLLNHVGVSTNLEIYDEPTESLSREGVADLVDMLAQRAKEAKKNIWLVDHHVIESSAFVDTVLVTKDKHGSHLN